MLAAELQRMDLEGSRAMRKLGVGATVLAVLLLTASAIAAVGATIVLTNGQRVRAKRRALESGYVRTHGG